MSGFKPQISLVSEAAAPSTEPQPLPTPSNVVIPGKLGVSNITCGISSRNEVFWGLKRNLGDQYCWPTNSLEPFELDIPGE